MTALVLHPASQPFPLDFPHLNKPAGNKRAAGGDAATTAQPRQFSRSELSSARLARFMEPVPALSLHQVAEEDVQKCLAKPDTVLPEGFHKLEYVSEDRALIERHGTAAGGQAKQLWLVGAYRHGDTSRFELKNPADPKGKVFCTLRVLRTLSEDDKLDGGKVLVDSPEAWTLGGVNNRRPPANVQYESDDEDDGDAFYNEETSNKFASEALRTDDRHITFSRVGIEPRRRRSSLIAEGIQGGFLSASVPSHRREPSPATYIKGEVQKQENEIMLQYAGDRYGLEHAIRMAQGSHAPKAETPIPNPKHRKDIAEHNKRIYANNAEITKRKVWLTAADRALTRLRSTQMMQEGSPSKSKYF